jgi:hypothetical protein
MSFILPDPKLNALSAKLAKLRPDSCQIRRGTPVDSDGFEIGEEEGYVDVGTPLFCRVAIGAVGQTSMIAGDPFQTELPYTVAFPRGTDVRQADQIVWNGITLDVVNVVVPTYDVETRVVCRKVS